MYPPHHYGGYELLWESAVEHLRGRGHDVEVLTTDTRTSDSTGDSEYVHRELRWHLRDAQFERLGPPAALRQARHNHKVLERHLRRVQPDVVSWWSMGGLTLTMLESVRRWGLPAVAFVHDDWLDHGREADAWLNPFRGRRARLAPLVEPLAGIPVRVAFDGAARYLFVSEH